MLRNKKTIWILAIVAALAIGFFVWRSISSRGDDGGTNDTVNYSSQTGNLPVLPGALPIEVLPGTTTIITVPASSSSKSATLTSIADEPVFDYWVNPATREVYYLRPDGAVFKALAGDDRALSLQTFEQIHSLVPSPDTQSALVSFGNRRELQWGVFSVIDEAWRPLPEGILAASWAGRSDQLIAITEQNSTRALVIINLARPGSDPQNIITPFNYYDVSLGALSTSSVIMTEPSSANHQGRAWLIDVARKQVHAIIQPTSGLMLVPGFPNPQALFYSASPDEFRILKHNLSLLAPTFFSTLAIKCSANIIDILCFAPKYFMPENPVLPDDYFMGAAKESDVLYRISIDSGETTTLLDGGDKAPPIDGFRPLSIEGDGIYFINRSDQSLWVLRQES